MAEIQIRHDIFELVKNDCRKQGYSCGLSPEECDQGKECPKVIEALRRFIDKGIDRT